MSGAVVNCDTDWFEEPHRGRLQARCRGHEHAFRAIPVAGADADTFRVDAPALVSLAARKMCVGIAPGSVMPGRCRLWTSAGSCSSPPRGRVAHHETPVPIAGTRGSVVSVEDLDRGGVAVLDLGEAQRLDAVDDDLGDVGLVCQDFQVSSM